MPIFEIDRQKARQLGLKRDGFGSEFELRDFFADNLEELLGVRFLAKEYSTTDGRIDTLGIDENDSPVIIEYKWRENEEVLAQGLFYLKWLLQNRRHFELLSKSKFGDKTKVNWDRPRLVLIAQGFSRYVKGAVQTIHSVELKTYTLYEDAILHIENAYSPIPERPTRRRTTTVAVPTRMGTTEYDLNYHLNRTSSEMQKAVNELRDRILELPSIEEKLGQKTGLTYRTTKSFTRLQFKPTWIEVLLREPQYADDTEGIVLDITQYRFGYRGKVKFTPSTDVNYLFTLIKASYNSTL